MALDKSDLNAIQELMTDSLAPVLESIELRFDGLDGRMDGLDGRMEKLEQGQIQNTHAILDLQTSVHKINTRLDSIEGRLAALENDIKEIYATIFKKPPVITRTTDKEKLLELYEVVLEMAKKLDVRLPHEV